MPPRHRLLVCPECACHAKLTETHCPSCGTALFDASDAKRRGAPLWPAPAAAIVAMGLTAVTCADEEPDTTMTGPGTMSQSTTSIMAGYTHGITTSTGQGGTGGTQNGGGMGGLGGSGGVAGAGGN